MPDLAAEPPPSRELRAWCEARLRSTVAEVLFTVRRLDTVIGLELTDGRQVVVKLSSQEWSGRRRAAQRIQAHLYREGFPCPRPIVGPAAFGSEIALAEELVEAGPAPNAHEPAIRRSMANGLAWQMRLTREVQPPRALERARPSWIDLRSRSLWPPPHHPKLDFDRTEPATEWIDQIAARAKRIFLESDKGRVVTAHSDWEAHNVRCSKTELLVAYDWDSLAVESELALVGRAAAVFTAHPDPAFGYAPSVDERSSFIAEFEEAAGRRFSRTERKVMSAVSTWATAYEARIAHAFAPELVDRPGSFTEALVALGMELP